jgi:hypothetical protein
MECTLYCNMDILVYSFSNFTKFTSNKTYMQIFEKQWDKLQWI